MLLAVAAIALIIFLLPQSNTQTSDNAGNDVWEQLEQNSTYHYQPTGKFVASIHSVACSEVIHELTPYNENNELKYLNSLTLSTQIRIDELSYWQECIYSETEGGERTLCYKISDLDDIEEKYSYSFELQFEFEKNSDHFKTVLLNTPPTIRKYTRTPFGWYFRDMEVPPISLKSDDNILDMTYLIECVESLLACIKACPVGTSGATCYSCLQYDNSELKALANFSVFQILTKNFK